MPRKAKLSIEEAEEAAISFNENEELFQNVSTVDNPNEVPEEFPYEFFKEEFKPFPHQKKTVYLCLEAEKRGIRETNVATPETGNIEGTAKYECRVGCIANGTGSGKTACAAALACYDIEDSEEEQNFGTGLMSLQFSPIESRPVIDITILLAKKSNVAKILSESERQLKDGLVGGLLNKAEFNTVFDNVKLRKLHEEYEEINEECNSLNSELEAYEEENSELLEQLVDEAQTRGETLEHYAKRKKQKEVLEYIELLDYHKEKTKELEAMKVFMESPEMEAGIKSERYKKEINENRKNEDRNNKLNNWIEDNKDMIEIAYQYATYFKLFRGKKLFVVSELTFQYIFPLFRKYRIKRLIIDEPHEINVTNDKYFRDHLIDNSINFLASPKNPEKAIAREPSPALMVWLMSATIHHMFDNEDLTSSYIIAWVSRNAPFMRDFLNSLKESYRFPQMVKRHIIKFSKAYSHKQIAGGKAMHEKIYLKIRRPVQLQLIEGIFEGTQNSEIETYMNDDDEEKIKRFFDIDDIEQIPQGIITKLQESIDALKLKIKGYTDPNGKPAKEAKEKIKELEGKIALVERRNRAIVEHESCSICYEDLTIPNYPDEEPSEEWLQEHGIVSCSSCFVRTHFKCYKQLRDKSHCASCRLSTIEYKPSFIYSKINKKKNTELIEEEDKHHDIITEREIVKYQEREEEEIYESKFNAFEVVMNDIETRDVVNFNDKVLKNKPVPKILIFLNMANGENQAKNQIMQYLVDENYVIFSQKNGKQTQQSLAALYHAPKKNIFKLAASKTQFTQKLEEFRELKEKSVWIMKDVNDASGMNFEFVTDLICYSSFGNMVQIIGRGERPGREFKFNVYIISYESKSDQERRIEDEKKNGEREEHNDEREEDNEGTEEDDDNEI